MLRPSAIAALLAQAVLCQAPSNNGCASPITVAYGVNPGAPNGASGSTYTNDGATDTLSSFLPDEASCTGGPDTFNNDVWFSFTPTLTGIHRVSTCTPPGFAPGTLEDTVVAVYSTTAMSWSCSNSTSWTEEGCGDENCLSLAEARVQLTAGINYRIRVGSYDDFDSGTFYLTIGGPTTANTCSAPVTIGVGTTFGHNYGASNGPAPFTTSSACTGGPGTFNDDVWYAFVPTVSGRYAISTATEDEDVVSLLNPPIAVYTANVCGSAAPNLELLGCTPSGDVPFAICMLAGVSYRIRVGSHAPNQEGTYLLEVSATTGMCLHATSPLGPGSLSLNVNDGTPGLLYFTCLTTNPVGFPDAWFFGIAPSTTEIFLQLGSNAPPFIGALNASGDAAFGPLIGLPPFRFYGVTLTFDAFWQMIDVTPPMTYAI